MCKLAGEQITCRWSSEQTTCSRKQRTLTMFLKPQHFYLFLYFNQVRVSYFFTLIYLFFCLRLPSFILISVLLPLLPSPSSDALGFHPSLLSLCESYFTARLIVKEKNENTRRCGTESGEGGAQKRGFLTVMELRCEGRIIKIMKGQCRECQMDL